MAIFIDTDLFDGYFITNNKFNKSLRNENIINKFWLNQLCDVSVFSKEYEKAVFYNELKDCNIKSKERDAYFFNAENDTSLSHFFIKSLILPSFEKTYNFQNGSKLIQPNIFNFWNKADIYRYKLNDNGYKLFNNKRYISYNAHKSICLKQFYNQTLFILNSCDKNSSLPGMYINLSNTFMNYINEHLQNLLQDEYNIAMMLKDFNSSQMKVQILHKKSVSSITLCDTLDTSVEYWSIDKVIKFLNINNHNLTLIWSIIYNLELSIYYCHNNLYFKVHQITALKYYVEEFLKEYIPVRKLNELLHKSRPIKKLSCEIVAPPAMLYYIMPENNRGFYFIKKISLNLLDELYNEDINCNSFLTEAEVKGDLYILPSIIPVSLACILLHLEKRELNEINKTHILYTDDSMLFCKRYAVIKLYDLQKFFQDNYVLEERVQDYLKLNITNFSEKDREILSTVVTYNAPNYVMYMKEYKDIQNNNRAYKKEDILQLREFFHITRNAQYDIKIDNDISCKDPYQTYLMRVVPLGLISTLEQISKPSAELWDSFVKLQLIFQQCSEKTINYKINQYIKTLNILFHILQENEISEFSNLQTGILNRCLKNVASVTYTNILVGFFKFAAIEYNSQGVKIKYRYKELKSPINTKSKPDDFLPEIYSFTEYSKVFNYCNDYYTHIEIAVNEILDNGTCIYASTWFYVMSHLNNAWRSHDFSMFPYIDILDVINRSTDNDARWFLNNKMTKSDATIISLRIQNNPKIISKTKKYTRFVCSDELLESYTTVYSLLVLYTTKYLSIETEFINHFENKYNGVNKSQLDYFFLNLGVHNYRFKSKKMNKTLLSMIDFLENFYVNNDVDIERRQAMLLRSHVEPTSTVHYIQKTKEVFDRITNMICARGEFGYAYEMIVKSVIDTENKLCPEDMTDKIREIRYMLPNMKDMDILYGFLNYTHKEQAEINEYINSLPLEELQSTLTKLYINHLGSKTDKYLSCIHNSCQKSQGRNDDCTHCIFHIPTIYTLTIICQSIQDDILCYQDATNEITLKKIINRIIKKSRDVLWGRQKYGDDVIREVLVISGTDYEHFLIILNNFHINQKKMEQIVGDKKDA